MICNICGGEIPEGSSTCPICGSPAPVQAANTAQGYVNQATDAAQGYVNQAADTAQGYMNQAADTAQNITGQAGNAGGTNKYSVNLQQNNFNPTAVPPMGDMGNPINNPYAGNMPQNSFNPAAGGYDPAGPSYEPYGGAATELKMPEKKSNTGLIIGIVAAVVVVGALVAMYFLGVFDGLFGGGKDGKYYLDSMSAYGMSLDADSLSSFGFDSTTMYIEISGDTATIHVEGLTDSTDTGSANVSFSGSTVTFSDPSGSGESFTGTYDSSAKTITIEQSGASMTFKKK